MNTEIKTLQVQFEKGEKEKIEIQQDPYCTWDEKEALLLGRPQDYQTQSTKSQVFDPRLSTIVFERAARVMAQFPTGSVQALTKDDKGKNILMNLVLKNYILPNANSQFDLMTKLRLADVYSLVYGSFFWFVDWRSENDYIGPDIWLLPIRAVTWQAGKVSIEDSDYIFIDQYVTRDWLEKRPKDKWKLTKLFELMDKQKSGANKAQRDATKKTYTEQRVLKDTSQEGKLAEVLLRTRFEKDRWVTYAPEFQDAGVLRDIENPHKNGEIPVVAKHAFPLLDRFIGLGEFERGKTLQYAINSLINLYLDGVKFSIFPPIIVNPDGVIGSSLQMRPAVKWLETTPNSIRQTVTSPQGIQTFQSTYSFLIAALLNQAGTTDTTVSRQTDPGLGKTPQALQMLAARENARDNWDRFMMEKAVEKTYNIFVDLVSKKQEKPIDLTLFKAEIKQIESIYEDIRDWVSVSDSGEMAKVKIRKEELSGAKYRFFIDAGSTMKRDEALENQAIVNILTLILKAPQVLQAMESDGLHLNFGELIKRFLITSGVQDWDKIVQEKEINQVQQPNMDMGAMAQGMPTPNMGNMEMEGQPPMAEGQAGQEASPEQIEQIKQYLSQALGG